MHVNDRVAGQMTDDTDPAHSRAPAAVRLRAPVLAHRPFAVMPAAALRVVILGYPSAMFFNDSDNYMTDAVTRSADIVRSDGYPLFLYILLPSHSLALVTMSWDHPRGRDSGGSRRPLPLLVTQASTKGWRPTSATTM